MACEILEHIKCRHHGRHINLNTINFMNLHTKIEFNRKHTKKKAIKKQNLKGKK